MSKHIDKDYGDLSKINFESFLRIRKKTLVQFLNENNITDMDSFNFIFETKLKEEFFIPKDLLNKINEILGTNETKEDKESTIKDTTKENPEEFQLETKDSKVSKTKKPRIKTKSNKQ